MNKDISNHHDHCPDSQLARLAEGDSSVHEEIDWSHLSECGECMAAYTEAVELRGLELAGVESMPVSGELLKLGKEISRGSFLSPRPAMLGGLAAAVLALIIWVPLQHGGREAGTASRFETSFAQIEMALISDFSNELILPGCTSVPGEESSPLRGRSSEQEAVSATLARLDSKNLEIGLDDEEYYWFVSGYMAQGHLLHAKSLLAGERTRQTGDSRFDILRAAVAYRQNDLESARAILDRVLDSEPGNDIARLDLAVVEAELGLVAEARRSLEQIQNRQANPLLELRAARLSRVISPE